MTVEAWDGIPPSPHLPGRYQVQRVVPYRGPVETWSWQPTSGTWLNTNRGEVETWMLEGRFALVGPEQPAEAVKATPMPPAEAWQQMSLF